MAEGFVYVLKYSNGRLYIGSTTDLERRLYAYYTGKVKTTKSRRPVKLVYKEELPAYTDARKRRTI